MSGMATSSGQVLTHDEMTAAPVHIPDNGDGCFKTELVVVRSPERTVKRVWWHGNDPRPEPHNHPWQFVSEILSGGYSERRWRLDDAGIVHDLGVLTFVEGKLNVVLPDHYHVVFDVLPGTRTLMTCGQAAPGNAWGYLIDGQHVPWDEERVADPTFLERFRRLNPHLRSGQ